MKDKHKNLVLFIGSLVVTLLLVEGLIVAYLHVAGKPGADLGMQIRQREAALVRADTADNRTTVRKLGSRIVLHPLFGFTYNPRAEANNRFGFNTPYEFELGDSGYVIAGASPDRSLTVGLFGGSFADFVGREFRYMEEQLAERFPDREPRVVNFAVGAHALPQPALIYLYFRDLVDVAVFMDGLNEVWNYPENNRAGVPPEYAKASQYRYMTSRQELTPESLAKTEEILKLRRRITRLTSVSLWPVLKHTRLSYYTWRTFFSRWNRRIKELTREIMVAYETGEAFFPVEDSAVVRFAARQWSRYHELVHGAATDDGKLTIHLLQPNPYVPGTKVLTEDEERVIRDGLRFQEWVLTGYPLLQEEIGELVQRGVVAEDLTRIFSDIEEDIWIDGAHPNSRGSRLIMDRAIELIEAHGAGKAGRAPTRP